MDSSQLIMHIYIYLLGILITAPAHDSAYSNDRSDLDFVLVVDDEIVSITSRFEISFVVAGDTILTKAKYLPGSIKIDTTFLSMLGKNEVSKIVLHIDYTKIYKKHIVPLKLEIDLSPKFLFEEYLILYIYPSKGNKKFKRPNEYNFALSTSEFSVIRN